MALDSTDFDGELAWWVSVARAFVGSPVVASAGSPPPQPSHTLTARGPES